VKTFSLCYTYDANGNTLTDASGRTFTWDFENRLIQAVVPGTNGGTTTFRYDPFGRRIYKESPNFTSVFLHDGSNLIETVNASGSEVAGYTQGLGVDEMLAMQRGGTTDHYDADGLGSITSLSSSAGALANTYIYDSFGYTTASTGSLRNYFQYTAREFDQETNLYYYRARYYDSSIGRFTSSDPVEFNGGVNFYLYTGNRPLVRIDPSGLDWIYHQASGKMNHVDDQTGETTEVCTGYSGHNFGLNNPFAQDIPGGPKDSDAGPLPQGSYTIGPLQNNETGTGVVLPDSMRLIPDPTNDMFGRSGFLIHGGNMKNKSSSQGCIVLPQDCRITIGSSNDKVLRVVQ
jgi:RHS repeat-associated protein